ncbi:MAG: methyltransferase domain-containing protein [Pseudomonadota bacterium]
MTGTQSSQGADTFERSCSHWSEHGRAGMEHFYALASVDYDHLAASFDWAAWLNDMHQRRSDNGPLRLLDVACGSGKFPVALNRNADFTAATLPTIDYGLLDPAAFSIAEARQALEPPFQPGPEFEMTLQDLDCAPGTFDVAWATHALYAIPAAELAGALAKMVAAVDGRGFIAHSAEAGHYIRFDRMVTEAFRDGQGTPYSSAEDIEQAFKQLGLAVEVKEITYTNGAPVSQRDAIEGYLQRCMFDDSISLDDLLGHPTTAAYLKTCNDGSAWRFKQNVKLFFFEC